MEQTIIEKMKLNDQLVKNLKELGFEEVKPNLYSKQTSENTILFRDYRKSNPCSYAYFKERRVSPYQFKEVKVIEKIEEANRNQDPNKLSAYA